MHAHDRTEILRMRVAGERARMEDLARIVSYAVTGSDASRRNGLDNRIAQRSSWLAELPPDDDGWAEWHGAAAHDADALVNESVALLITRFIRSEGIGADTFDAAEAFLRELTTGADIPSVVLGQTLQLESIDHTRRSVSIRFPGSRIWDLPFLAHEFGHHAVAQLPHVEPAFADKRPLAADVAAVAQMLATGPRPGRAEAHAGELVADAVATTCCGASYPIASLCLRVPPPPASLRATDSHPPWQDRVATMRATMDALSDCTGLARYRSQRAAVVDPLAETLLGALPPTSAASSGAAERTVKSVHKHRPDLIYTSGDVANDVMDSLRCRASVPPAGATVAAVIDGAWRWRLNGGGPEGDVAARVVAYCRSIAAKGSGAHVGDA